MRFFRSQRISKLIREQLGEIIVREVEFSDALATITGVDVDKKLEHATVKVSIIPSEKADAAVKSLERSAARFQHLLMKKINIKPMPRISFQIDHGYENAARVEKQLMGK